jgi:hypothetical protein
VTYFHSAAGRPGPGCHEGASGWPSFSRSSGPRSGVHRPGAARPPKLLGRAPAPAAAKVRRPQVLHDIHDLSVSRACALVYVVNMLWVVTACHTYVSTPLLRACVCVGGLSVLHGGKTRCTSLVNCLDSVQGMHVCRTGKKQCVTAGNMCDGAWCGPCS